MPKPVEIRGPFQVTNRETVFKNPWFEVVRDNVLNTNTGKSLEYNVVKNRQAVSVLPIDDEGFIHLAKEFKYALNKSMLITMGGFIEDGENEIEAAKRELKEELGISAKAFIDCGEMVFFGSITDAKYNLFIAKGLEFGKSHQEENESVETIKMSLDDAYRAVLNNEIVYAPAIALILKAYSLNIH